MQEYSGSYYATKEAICEALGRYFYEKSTRGIYARQWAAETDGIFYDVSGMGQYDIFGGKNGPVDITTFINNMGPQWEAIYMAKTNADYLNDLQMGLDLCSCFPVVFIPAQGANILISFARGNTKDALIRVGAVVVVGIAAKVVSVAVNGTLKSAVERCGTDTALMKNTVEMVAEALETIYRAGVSADDLIRWGIKSDTSIMKLSEFIKAGLKPKENIYFYEWFNRSTMGFDELDNLGIKTYSDLNNALLDYERMGDEFLGIYLKDSLSRMQVMLIICQGITMKDIQMQLQRLRLLPVSQIV